MKKSHQIFVKKIAKMLVNRNISFSFFIEELLRHIKVEYDEIQN